MSPPRLAQALRAPVDLEFNGPGGGTWTLRRAGNGVEVVTHAEGSAARLTTTIDDFLLWGTRRLAWQEAGVTLIGDHALANDVASAIHVF